MRLVLRPQGGARGGPLGLLLLFDRVPGFRHFVRREIACVTENVRVTADQFRGDSLDHAAKIKQVFQNYRKSGRGEKTLLFNGSRVRHYALTDQKEFFAEMTESYFGVNDFFPFTRAELKESEPEIFELMQGIWGPSSR